MEFNARTRRSRIIYFPEDYAALETAVGSAWLTRREMFERVEAALAAEAAPPPESAQAPWLGPAVVTTLGLIVACVILAAIASALVLSPSLARTRRIISAAYQSSVTPIATPAPSPTIALAANALISPLAATPTPPVAEEADKPSPAPTVEAPRPTLDRPPPTATATALSPPPAQNSPLPVPEAQATLPPTFTPPPTAPLPTPTAPAIVLPTPLPPTATPTIATPLPTVTPPAQPTPTIVFGSVIFEGTIRIRTIQAVGTGPGQADEFVELYNEGTTQVSLDNWSLKAIRTADNTVIDTYLFGNGAIIAAGQVCRIYTNVQFAPDNCGFSGGFASETPIWPDQGGARASLFDQRNVEQARYTY